MRTAVTLIAFLIPAPVVAQFADLENLTEVEQALLDEHAWFGLPSTEHVLIRQGYVISYDTLRRVPRWVAYRVTLDSIATPCSLNARGRFRVPPQLEVPKWNFKPRRGYPTFTL